MPFDPVSYYFVKRALGFRADRLTIDRPKAIFVLGAGEEKVVDSVHGTCYCTVFFDGDGDGASRVRVYVDGRLEDDFPTNEARVGFYACSSSLEIKIYNPTPSIASQTSTSYSLRGLLRRP
jgi:hypothetical protein